MMDHHLGGNSEACPWFEQADLPHVQLLLQPLGLLAERHFECAALGGSLFQQPHAGSLVQQPQLANFALMQAECSFRTSPGQPSDLT